MPENTYRIISFDRQTGIGVADSWQVTISAVAKTNVQKAPYCVPNELVCAEIGRFLRLPIPPAGIIIAPAALEKFWFASLDFNLTGNSLPPVDPIHCFNKLPDLCTGLLLFDALVLNCDRHRGNLALDISGTTPRLNIFDHSHALFGNISERGCERLKGLRDRLGISGGPLTSGNRHCLLDVVSTDDHFDKWLTRSESIPNFFVEELCQDAGYLGASDDEISSLVDTLNHRKQNLRRIIDQHRSEFTSVRTWRLISS